MKPTNTVLDQVDVDACERRGYHLWAYVETSEFGWGLEECTCCGLGRNYGIRRGERRAVQVWGSWGDKGQPTHQVGHKPPAAQRGSITQRALRDERNARIVAMRKQGTTLKAIAESIGLSEQMVSKVCAAAGLGRK